MSYTVWAPQKASIQIGLSGDEKLAAHRLCCLFYTSRDIHVVQGKSPSDVPNIAMVWRDRKRVSRIISQWNTLPAPEYFLRIHTSAKTDDGGLLYKAPGLFWYQPGTTNDTPYLSPETPIGIVIQQGRRRTLMHINQLEQIAMEMVGCHWQSVAALETLTIRAAHPLSDVLVRFYRAWNTSGSVVFSEDTAIAELVKRLNEEALDVFL